jgi:hypothetical protein
MLLLLVLIVLFGISTQYRDGFMDDQDSMDSSMSSMSSLRRQLPPMVSSCVKDGLRQFDDLQ